MFPFAHTEKFSVVKAALKFIIVLYRSNAISRFSLSHNEHLYS